MAPRCRWDAPDSVPARARTHARPRRRAEIHARREASGLSNSEPLCRAGIRARVVVEPWRNDRMPPRRVALLTLGFALMFSQLAQAGDAWPDWRGPHGDGKVPEERPPLKWDATTGVLWKTAV